MFTGIISDVGTLKTIESSGAGMSLSIESGYDTGAIALGASIACAGICLTVVETDDDWFGVEASHETIDVTTLGDWQAGRRINLERALAVGDALDGHIVLGHVDGVARLASRQAEGENVRMEFELGGVAAPLARYVARKGSVAIDGVSLTVNLVSEAGRVPAIFDVNLIPYSLAHTSLADLAVGDGVNIEIDLMARYAARLQAFEE